MCCQQTRQNKFGLAFSFQFFWRTLSTGSDTLLLWRVSQTKWPARSSVPVWLTMLESLGYAGKPKGSLSLKCSNQMASLGVENKRVYSVTSGAIASFHPAVYTVTASQCLTSRSSSCIRQSSVSLTHASSRLPACLHMPLSASPVWGRHGELFTGENLAKPCLLSSEMEKRSGFYSIILCCEM